MKQINDKLVEFGEHDERTVEQLIRCADYDFCAGGALCADGHVGYAMPIGGVAAYRGYISPSGVGYDIACGNMAVRTNLHVDDLKDDLAHIMDAIQSTISFGVGRKNENRVDHELFDSPDWHAYREIGKHEHDTLKALARDQLGTVGSGNHYVDLFEDANEGDVWVGVHFGSRGFGHRTASGFLNLAEGREFSGKAPGEKMDNPPTLIDATTELGDLYLTCMNLAGQYAYAGREYVVGQVLKILGASSTFEVHNHHNFCVPGNAIVPTLDGPKYMKDVKAGDLVYTFKRGQLEPTKVLSHWKSGYKRLRTFDMSSRELSVSEDHPILTISVSMGVHPTRPWNKKRIGSFEWKKASEINVGDIIVCGEGYYPESINIGEAKARIVGAMLGDGWIRHTPKRQGYTVGLAIGNRDELHTERYRRLLQENIGSTTWKIDATGHYGLSCSSVDVWTEMQSLGVTGYSNSKRVPPWAFGISRSEKLALLAGYMDADGSVANSNSSNHGRGTVASINRELVEGLRELMISCNMRVTPIRTEHRTTNMGTCTVYRCTMDVDSTNMLDLWHVSKSKNQRKSKFMKSKGLTPNKIGYIDLPEGIFAQRVSAIRESGIEVPVFDISVEDDSHSFICDGVIVHNCWKESHNGEDVYVVRKGATPSAPGQWGFIGGSMCDIAVIVQGVESEENKASFYSTVHGAGRVMSRTQAAGKMNWKTRTRSGGQITPEQMYEAVRAYGVELRGAGTDESPFVYRQLKDVLDAHGDSIKAQYVLKPIGVCMAGGDEFDPYKD